MLKRCLIVATTLLLARSVRAEDNRFEKTVAFPRGTEVKLDWGAQGITIRSVECRNYPDSEDIEKARTKDHDDHSWLWWEFHADNRTSKDAKIRFWVEILDAKGNVVKASDRSGSIDAGKIDDSFRVSTRLRTLDIVESPKVRLKAEILPR